MKQAAAIVVFLAAGVWPAAACEEIADCYAGRQAVEMFKDIAKSAERKGKQTFGDAFKVHNRIRFSQRQRVFYGNLDATFAAGKVILQTGMTAWDSRKMGGRRDLRFGVVHRRADVEGWYGGMVGAWGFVQMDSVGGNMRLIGGGDYTGKFGKMSASYYVGGGKMLSGGDMRLDLDLTRRLSVGGRVSHWTNRTNAAEYRTSINTSASYKWREWIAFGGSWKRTTNGRRYWTLRTDLQFALGAKKAQRKSSYKPNYERMLHLPMARFKRVEYAL